MARNACARCDGLRYRSSHCLGEDRATALGCAYLHNAAPLPLMTPPTSFLGDGLGCAISDDDVRHGHTGLAGEIAHLVTAGPQGQAIRFVEYLAIAACMSLDFREAGRVLGHARLDHVVIAVSQRLGSLDPLLPGRHGRVSGRLPRRPGRLPVRSSATQRARPGPRRGHPGRFPARRARRQRPVLRTAGHLRTRP